MNELEKILAAAAVTIIVGGLAYLIKTFVFDPIHDLRKVISEVRYNLAFHAATISTPIARTKATSDKATDALMNSSSELIAKLNTVCLYGIASSLSCGVLPPRKAVEDAAVQLRGLSTYMHEQGQKAINSLGTISTRIERIEKLLGLKVLP